MSSAFLGLALALCVGAVDGESDEASNSIRWYAIPNVAFISDDGVGFGARGEMAFDEEGYEPYRQALMAHVFATTRGYHNHQLRYDRIGLAGHRRLRLTAYAAWRQWLNDGYWGIGNRTLRERVYLERASFGSPDQKRYRYKLFQPFVHTTLRITIDGPWSAFVSLNPKWSKIETYPGSLLAEQRPFGTAGGSSVIISSGLLFDTREPEVSPRRGVLLELSARGSPPLPRGAGAFIGAFLSARLYCPLGSRLVLALRGMNEYLAGDVPFYELVHWGGLEPISGFGGAYTLRGASFGRWRAPGKAIGNAELRLDVFAHDLLGKSFAWLVAGWTDAGITYGAQRTRSRGNADLLVHPGAGFGVRLVYEEVFVGRVDAGWAYDPILEPDGRVVPAATLGLYVVFEHIF